MGLGKILGKLIKYALIKPIVWIFDKIIMGAIVMILSYLFVLLILWIFKEDLLNFILGFI